MDTTAATSDREYEHVFLISDELEEVDFRSVDTELEQAGADARRRLMIFNGAYLRVLREDVDRVSEDYWINLAFVDPNPVRCWSTRWSAAAGICAVALIGAVVLRHGPLSVFSVPLLPVAIALSAISGLACSGVALWRYFGELVFLSINGRAPVFWMSSRQPDRRRVKDFLGNLRTATERARKSKWDSRGSYLRDEMKEHRRLQNEGVLTEEQFLLARGLILRAHG